MTQNDTSASTYRDIQRWPVAKPELEREEPKVFGDPTARRAYVTTSLALIIMLGLALWATDFAARVFWLKPIGQYSQTEAFLEQATTLATSRNAYSLAPTRVLSGEGCADTARGPELPKLFAYVPLGDEKSRASYRANCGQIDTILYDAATLQPDGKIVPHDLLARGRTIADWLGAGQPPQSFQILRPAAGITGAGLGRLLSSPEQSSHIAEGLVRSAADGHAAGACLNLADAPALPAEALKALLSAWHSRAQQSGQKLCLIAGATAAFWSNPGLLDAVDHIVLRAFEISRQPYPPAPRAYVRDTVLPLVASLSTEKLILALPSFGLIWRSGDREPFMLSYADAMLWADVHGAEVEFPAEHGNARVSFVDHQRRRNEIWLADAAIFEEHFDGFADISAAAIWPLGYEDPGVWEVLRSFPQTAGTEPARLAIVDIDRHLAILGTGPFVIDAKPAKTGMRRITARTGNGHPGGVSYPKQPTPARVIAFGGRELGSLAMTFDGLPDADDAQDLLELLADRKVTATFFATANDLLAHHDVVAALADAGHAFGTTLLSLEAEWPGSTVVRRWDLNYAQLYLSYLTETRTAFVRETSGRLNEPATAADFEHLTSVLEAGYIPVAPGIRPVADDDGALSNDGLKSALYHGEQIVSLSPRPISRDGFTWLGELVDDLKLEGFQFVGMKELAMTDIAADAIPVAEEQIARDGISFSVLQALHGKLAIVFIAMLSLDASRSFIYLTLAFLRRRHSEFDIAFAPEVTVLVPAYNEESVISRCLNSLVQSDYPRLRIVVIDDGSGDQTAEIVKRDWGDDQRITLLTEENQGKWHAANFALDSVRSPIFVGVDADTILAPDAISWLVQQFKNPQVGAVAGFVEVGNRTNFLTRCQALEYIVSQSVGRRAFEMFNGILVVPGAIGAWRTDAVREAGLYSPSTITEDADLTVAVHRAGYKVRFEENARAFTEAPVKVTALVRQRIRWALGMLQTSWKHRRAICEGRAVGFISIVDAIWISFLSSLAAPLVDILLIGLILHAGYVLATVGLAAINLATMVAVLGYFSLVIVDMISATGAFILDRRRDFYLVLIIPLLRFGYRQLIILSALVALGRAISGRLYGWNKLARTGTVHVAEGELVLKR